jgi:hypothetical protein
MAVAGKRDMELSQQEKKNYELFSSLPPRTMALGS